MATILEALQNANHNFNQTHGFGLAIAKDQLNNAVTLLELDYQLHEEIEPLLDEYGSIDKVPLKQDHLARKILKSK